MDHLVEKLDAIAERVEAAGYVKEAAEIDIISNTLEVMAADKKKWIQKAVPESHEGKFGAWCKSHGYEEGVCQGCIDKAVAAGGDAQKMALFAVNVSKGKYTYPKGKDASEEVGAGKKPEGEKGD